MDGVCYSPDGKMIATGGKRLKIWDADTGELLKTFQVGVWCLAWTSRIAKHLSLEDAEMDTKTEGLYWTRGETQGCKCAE